MVQYIDNGTNNALSKWSNYSLILFYKKILKKHLEKNWDACLSVLCKNHLYLSQSNQYCYFLPIDAPSEYNYLLLAKLVNVISKTYKLKHAVRQLIKNEYDNAILVKILSKNLITKSIFLRWLLRLSMEHLNAYIQRYIVNLLKSAWIIDYEEIQLQYFHGFLYCDTKDLLILNFYTFRSRMWYTYSVPSYQNTKKKINHTLLKMNGDSRCIYSLPSIHKDQKGMQLSSNNMLNIPGRVFSTKKHIDIIKKFIQRNQTSIQFNLIKHLNELITNWDRVCPILAKKQYSIKLNDLLYKTLWRWAISRHSRKSAKWIKKRYWHQTNTGFYFSDY
jgi:Group II intron, maturase-specific domain